MEAGRNISAYNRGMKDYRTPNIDHIANEGANFTDYYGQQSCAAGRPAFITGPSPDAHRASQNRPAGGREGLSDKAPRLARLSMPQGCGWL
jgi:arylsulfatase